MAICDPREVAISAMTTKLASILSSKVLRERTQQTATSFGGWLGTNEIIKQARHASAPIDDQIGIFLNDLALMTVVRVYALLEKKNPISFQDVYHRLKSDSENNSDLSLIAPWAGANDLPLVSVQIDSFRASYQKINWRTHGQLAAFRNLTVAHLTDQQGTGITYGDVHALVSICCELSDRCSMIAEGLNAYESQRMNEQAVASYEFWRDLIELRYKISLPKFDKHDWSLRANQSSQ